MRKKASVLEVLSAFYLREMAAIAMLIYRRHVPPGRLAYTSTKYAIPGREACILTGS